MTFENQNDQGISQLTDLSRTDNADFSESSLAIPDNGLPSTSKDKENLTIDDLVMATAIHDQPNDEQWLSGTFNSMTAASMPQIDPFSTASSHDSFNYGGFEGYLQNPVNFYQDTPYHYDPVIEFLTKRAAEEQLTKRQEMVTATTLRKLENEGMELQLEKQRVQLAQTKLELEQLHFLKNTISSQNHGNT